MSSQEKQYEVEYYYDADGNWVGTDGNRPKRTYARSPEAAIKLAFEAESMMPGEVYYVRELGPEVKYQISDRRVSIKIEKGDE